MNEHVTSAASDMAQMANAKASAAVLHASLAGGITIANVSPETVEKVKFGETLANYGMFGLSWIEIISAIGAIYLVYNFSLSIYDRILLPSYRLTSRFLRSAKSGQQTR